MRLKLLRGRRRPSPSGPSGPSTSPLGFAGIKAIHVMDREADIYELLSEMVCNKRAFVIRASHDRALVGDGPGEVRNLIASGDRRLCRAIRRGGI